MEDKNRAALSQGRSDGALKRLGDWRRRSESNRRINRCRALTLNQLVQAGINSAIQVPTAVPTTHSCPVLTARMRGFLDEVCQELATPVQACALAKPPQNVHYCPSPRARKAVTLAISLGQHDVGVSLSSLWDSRKSR